MRCPCCDAVMRKQRLRGALLGRCTECSGTWIPFDGFCSLLSDERQQASVREQVRHMLGEPSVESDRSCPRCRPQRLHAGLLGGLPVEICHTCEALFFDPGELGTLVRGDRPSLNERVRERTNEFFGVNDGIQHQPYYQPGIWWMDLLGHLLSKLDDSGTR